MADSTSNSINDSTIGQNRLRSVHLFVKRELEKKMESLETKQVKKKGCKRKVARKDKKTSEDNLPDLVNMNANMAQKLKKKGVAKISSESEDAAPSVEDSIKNEYIKVEPIVLNADDYPAVLDNDDDSEDSDLEIKVELDVKEEQVEEFEFIPCEAVTRHDDDRIGADSTENSMYETQNLLEKAKRRRIACKVWGWIHLYGIGELTEIAGHLTADQYIEILEEVMIPSVRAYALPYPEKIIFMQYDCSIPTTKTVQRWFAEQRDIEVLHWPSKAWDLNPIENIWNNIVNCWDEGQERTKEGLLKHTMHEWEMLRGNQQTVFNSVSLMQNRLQDVIANDGDWTNQ